MEYQDFEFLMLFIARFGLRSDILMGNYHKVVSEVYQAYTVFDNCFAEQLNCSRIDGINIWLVDNDDVIARKLSKVKEC